MISGLAQSAGRVDAYVQSTTAFLYRGIIERYPVGLTLAF